jgi:glutamyl-tRNA synthetase
VRWDGLVRGAQHVDAASQSDPVLVRADGSYLYSFTSVVDDIAFGITHVIGRPGSAARAAPCSIRCGSC